MKNREWRTVFDKANQEVELYLVEDLEREEGDPVRLAIGRVNSQGNVRMVEVDTKTKAAPTLRLPIKGLAGAAGLLEALRKSSIPGIDPGTERQRAAHHHGILGTK